MELCEFWNMSEVEKKNVYIWCSDCAEFHKAHQTKNPLGGDNQVWTDECESIVVLEAIDSAGKIQTPTAHALKLLIKTVKGNPGALIVIVVNKFAQVMGLSRDNVIDYLKTLEAHGDIKRVGLRLYPT